MTRKTLLIFACFVTVSVSQQAVKKQKCEKTTNIGFLKTHKTGSTTLQVIKLNNNQLLQKQGITRKYGQYSGKLLATKKTSYLMMDNP